MWMKIIKTTDTYKRQPHTVTGVRIKQVGSKYYIYADMKTLSPKVIGRYNSYREAQSALETIKNITNSNMSE